jgi:hypothetical protein
MPVFQRIQSGVLVVTVDGDFTVEEVVRVGQSGLQSPEAINPAFVILDLSGTAGLDQASGRLESIATFFAGPQTPVAKLAVMALADVAAVVVEHARASGLEAAAFSSKSNALDWLLEV